MIATNNDNIEGFVIDPKGCNIAFTKDMIKEIKQNITREGVVEKDTQIEIGNPKDYPQELVNKLKDLFLNMQDVKKAYLQLMTKNDEIGYLIVIYADGKEKELFNTIASAAIPFLNGMPLNMVESDSELAKTVEEKFEPFYTKE